jgi:hypothetical protein
MRIGFKVLSEKSLINDFGKIDKAILNCPIFCSYIYGKLITQTWRSKKYLKTIETGSMKS